MKAELRAQDKARRKAGCTMPRFLDLNLADLADAILIAAPDGVN